MVSHKKPNNDIYVSVGPAEKKKMGLALVKQGQHILESLKLKI